MLKSLGAPDSNQKGPDSNYHCGNVAFAPNKSFYLYENTEKPNERTHKVTIKSCAKDSFTVVKTSMDGSNEETLSKTLHEAVTIGGYKIQNTQSLI